MLNTQRIATLVLKGIGLSNAFFLIVLGILNGSWLSASSGSSVVPPLPSPAVPSAEQPPRKSQSALVSPAHRSRKS
jgi:hypothetical protein